MSQALVFQNSKNILVLIAVTDSCLSAVQLLHQVRERTTTSALLFPRAVIKTIDPFPVTANLKLKRSDVVRLYREAAEEATVFDSDDDETARGLDMVTIASSLLGHPVNPSCSFLENGGDSMTAVRWLKQLQLLGDGRDWRSKLNDPLDGSGSPEEESIVSETGETIQDEPEPNPSAPCSIDGSDGLSRKACAFGDSETGHRNYRCLFG